MVCMGLNMKRWSLNTIPNHTSNVFILNSFLSILSKQIPSRYMKEIEITSKYKVPRKQIFFVTILLKGF